MSCSLIKHCVIGNLKTLKQILFPEEKTEQEILQDDDWDNRWNWDTSESYLSANKQEAFPNWWLSMCHISISPYNDLVALARDKNIAIYKQENNTFHKEDDGVLSWATTLTGLEHNETITSISFVPLISQQKSAGGTPDWTCLIVGFTSGFIRIYTEMGGLLISQLFHEEPVIGIKCQTFALSENGEHDQADEILVVYKSAVVLIDAFVLYQTLRSCRNQLAKAQSNRGTFGFDFMNNAIDTNNSFVFKKFSLQNSDKINDCDNVGNYSSNLYDHLVSQSISRGPSVHPKANSSSANILITSGDNPYIGFYRAHESENQTILNEMATAVMNKVKNIVPTSLFGFKKSEDSTKPKIESSIPIPQKIGLFDQNREGLKVNIAPNRRLCAVSDDFGRVTLFDIHKMIAIRMWKGYRDAEIGWVEAEEDSSSKSARKVLFLIIYAPKRGILEIWCCQMGPRVTAFNVGKNCKLIQCNYSMIGLNSLTVNLYNQIPDFFKSKCYLIDYTTATIYKLYVPFLCALTDRNSKKTRDLHLLKEINNILKEESFNNDKIISLILEMKTADVRKEAIELIIQMDDIKLIELVVNEIKSQLTHLNEKNELDYDNQLIAQMCIRIEQVIKLYSYICNQQNVSDQIVKESANPPEIQELIETLGWDGPSIVRCLSLLVYKDSVEKKKDHITPCKIIQICQFLSFFVLYSNQLVKDKNGQLLFENIPIEIITNQKLSFDQFTELSKFIFLSSFLTNQINIEDCLKQSAIIPSNLLKLLFISWLSSNCCDHWKSWENFRNVLNVVDKMCKIENDFIEDQLEEENHLQTWKEVIDIVYESCNITASLIATHMIKAINSGFTEKTEEKRMNQSGQDMEWETLSIDHENLNFLIKQLEYLFLLELLLMSEQSQNEDFTNENISLRLIMTSGPGIVSELVAKWAIKVGIESDVLCHTNERMEDDSLKDGILLGEEALQLNSTDTKPSIELLDHVRRCFPNCLEPDVLLANCAWESFVFWDNNPSITSFELLKNSFVYLNRIASAVLKHNVACLIWKTFILKRFETLTNLMEKMGKVPKDRICKKELGMDECCLESFLDYSCQLLDFILENNRMAEIEPLPIFTIDEWWKSQTTESSIKLPLVMVAVQQKVANAALVLEHSRLSTSMLFIATFQLKNTKPLSLISPVVHSYLFRDFHVFSVYYSNKDSKLAQARTKHLINVISAIAQSLPIFGKNQDEQELLASQSKVHSQANKWFGKVISLAREWELDIDHLKQHFVCELYKNCCDLLAKEVVSSVNDLPNLGLQMLNIAGKRIIHLINEKFGTIEQMHTLPPNVVFWLKSLNVDVQSHGSSSQSTLAMLEQINNYVYGDQSNRKICEALIDAVKTL